MTGADELDLDFDPDMEPPSGTQLASCPGHVLPAPHTTVQGKRRVRVDGATLALAQIHQKYLETYGHQPGKPEDDRSTR